MTQTPTDPSSDVILRQNYSDLAGSYLHPDFSSVAGGNYGIPYDVVDSTKTSSVPVAINLYASESDITMAPIPDGASIEGSPADCQTPDSDRHMIILDRASCVAYEYWQASSCKSKWSASNAALWDFTKTEQRPQAYTSADAAGLSIFEGLLRYDEIVAGHINHALRFTAQHTKNDQNNGYFVAPATHAAGTLWGTDNIIGMRIRLKADFDISGFSPVNQIILKAMKQYGMILADNGSNMFFQGTPDSRWNDDDLSMLKAIPVSAFDVLKMGTVYDASTVPGGVEPQIVSFTASQTTVRPGEAVVLTSNVMNSSYSYIDNAGFTRGAVTVTPAATTTYQLTSRNAYGSSTAAVTVQVQKPLVIPTITMASIPTQTLGAGPIALSAKSTSPAAIVFSILSGPAKVVGAALSAMGAGQIIVRASQAATSDSTTNYGAAMVEASLQVIAPKTLAALAVRGTASPISSGAQTYVTVSALDANGRVIPTYTGRILLVTTDLRATLPVTYTFLPADAGVHTFPVKFKTPGVQLIFAADSLIVGMQAGIRVVGPVVVLDSKGALNTVSVSGDLIASAGGSSLSASPHGGVVADSAGNAWSVTSGSDALLVARADGTTNTYNGGGLSAPTAIALDGSGRLWVANEGSHSLSAFLPSGSALTETDGYGRPLLGAGISGLAVDSSGGVWVASRSDHSVTHLIGIADPVTTPLLVELANNVPPATP